MNEVVTVFRCTHFDFILLIVHNVKTFHLIMGQTHHLCSQIYNNYSKEHRKQDITMQQIHLINLIENIDFDVQVKVVNRVP